MNRGFGLLVAAAIAICGVAWFFYDRGGKALAPSVYDRVDQRAVGAALASVAPSQPELGQSDAKLGDLRRDAAVSTGSSLMLRGEDWGRFPGSLADQVRTAMERRDGAMAHHVANRLSDCIWFVLLPQEMGQANMGGSKGLAPEEQKIRSLCQTVPGDIPPQMLQLYEIAIEKKSLGAASDLLRVSGSLGSRAGQQLFEDAKAGHALSAISVASVLPSAIGLGGMEPAISRQALRYAAQQVDPAVGERWIEAERSISAAWGNKQDAAAQTVKLDDAAKKSAELMAAKLVERAAGKS